MKFGFFKGIVIKFSLGELTKYSLVQVRGSSIPAYLGQRHWLAPGRYTIQQLFYRKHYYLLVVLDIGQLIGS